MMGDHVRRFGTASVANSLKLLKLFEFQLLTKDYLWQASAPQDR